MRFPRAATMTLLFGFTILLSAAASSGLAGENYAMLVAVGDYDPKQLHRLQWARNDIQEFHDLLLQSRFARENVVLMHDGRENAVPARLLPEAVKIRKQLALLLAGRDEDDTVILAFAGHGVQFKGDEANYFCPLDVELEKKETLISFGEVYGALKACKARRKLLLVDACRNDPRTNVSRGRMTVDLETVTRPQKQPVPENVLAFFSCAAGQQSFEWPELKHGVFFYHLLDVWRKGVEGQGELTLDDVVYQTRKRTESFARNTLEAVQTPEFHGKAAGRWVLRSFADEKAFVNSIGMKLVLIPAGEYLRGSPDTDKDAESDEKPQHHVRISRKFYLAATCVTQSQWKAVMNTTPWGRLRPEAEENQYGATGIGWKEANDFCRRLGELEKRTYRLPTEAEWEYSCRAGSKTIFSFGDDPMALSDYAWNSPHAHQSLAPTFLPFPAVARKKPNAFGLHDMHGYLCEWCSDWYDPKAYARFQDTTATDPTGPVKGEAHVVRGIGWYHAHMHARSACRNVSGNPGIAPENGSPYVGFRVVAESR